MVSALYSKVVASTKRRTGSVPELSPWREVGWIFRNGEAIAVERQGASTRLRATAL